MLAMVGAPAQAAPPARWVRFYATTDVHGHVMPTPQTLVLAQGRRVTVERGGSALLAGYLAIARRHHPGEVVLIDCGDMFQGTLASNFEEGRVVIRAMNALGYAAAALGNHDFDFGPVGPDATVKAPGQDPRGALKARAAEATFPFLSANVLDARGEPPGAPKIKRFTLLTVNQVRVAIVGASTEDTLQTTIRPNVVGLKVEPLAPAIGRAAAEARVAGATVVVAAVHAGGECERLEPVDDAHLGAAASCRSDSELFRVARELKALEQSGRGGKVDALFGGHSHQGVSAVVAGIPVAQAFANGQAVSQIALEVGAGGRPTGHFRVEPPTELCSQVIAGTRFCDARHRGEGLEPARYENEVVTPDPKLTAVIAPALERVAEIKARPVGIRLLTPIKRALRAESALGDLVADIIRAATHAEIGVVNGGGLRADLPAGDLTYGELYEALPFDNRLATMRLSGAVLRRLMRRNLEHDQGFLALSGLQVAAACAGGQLKLTLTLADGRPVEDQHTYVLGTVDFLALGGAEFSDVVKDLAPGAVTIDEAGPVLRDHVAAAFKRRGTPLSGEDSSIFDPARPRVKLPGPRPIRCAL